MQIKYKNNKIEAICTDSEIARREYNVAMADKIAQRMVQLKSAISIENLLQLHIGRCHKLRGKRQGQYAMDLVHPYRLVFIMVKQRISIVEIQEIVDYH